MANINLLQLIHKYKLISDQVDENELLVVLTELEKSLKIHGAVVEFGCYKGTTSLYIRRILDSYKDSREFYVYDSFEGLPPKDGQDQSPLGIQFKEGELMVSKNQLIKEFKKARLTLPEVHKGWFNQLASTDIPSTISFAFLDGDYYGSIKSSFSLIENKLARGATIVVDDYANAALPGAAKAVDEWCKKKGYKPRLSHSLAIINCN